MRLPNFEWPEELATLFAFLTGGKPSRVKAGGVADVGEAYRAAMGDLDQIRAAIDAMRIDVSHRFAGESSTVFQKKLLDLTKKDGGIDKLITFSGQHADSLDKSAVQIYKSQLMVFEMLVWRSYSGSC